MGNIQVQPGTQIGVARCPSDFGNSDERLCRVSCPAGFKYLESREGEPAQCVHEGDNKYAFDIFGIPAGMSQGAFQLERRRVMQSIQEVQKQIDEDVSAQQALESEMNNYSRNASEYETIKSQYSAYNNVHEATGKIKDTIEVLKPFRGPAAPDMSSQMEIERRNILDAVSQKLVMVQVALVTILICVIEYIVLPNEYAHKVAFITAAIGLGVGIFLMSKK